MLPISWTREIQNLVFLARFHLDVDVGKGDGEMMGDGGDG
jgi:hypothetical protein